jgi:hypothetical protein
VFRAPVFRAAFRGPALRAGRAIFRPAARLGVGRAALAAFFEVFDFVGRVARFWLAAVRRVARFVFDLAMTLLAGDGLRPRGGAARSRGRLTVCR